MPQEFVKDGLQFVNRCTKPDKVRREPSLACPFSADPSQREFIKISQAVGVGFLIMGVIGYVVKLVHSMQCPTAVPTTTNLASQFPSTIFSSAAHSCARQPAVQPTHPALPTAWRPWRQTRRRHVSRTVSRRRGQEMRTTSSTLYNTLIW